MIVKVMDLQGNARVINYAGRARGATQRLIKQELAGYENDELIHSLDSILMELKTDLGEHNLILLKDKNYRSKLYEQVKVWEELKELIYITRVDYTYNRKLYDLSEKYYEIADNTVDAAEIYSDRSTAFLSNLEIVIIMDSLIIIIIIIMLIYDSIYLSRLNNNLNEIAFRDGLTGLPNRSYCEMKVKENGLISKDEKICCLMFDLNNLKVINDQLGHDMGNKLIVNFANILKNSAPENMFIGRFGGDEFIGLIREIEESNIMAFISKLEDNVKIHNYNNSPLISYAYGYAMSSNSDEITIKELLIQADNKMYQRKAQMKKSNI